MTQTKTRKKAWVDVFTGFDIEGTACLYVQRGRKYLPEAKLKVVAEDLQDCLNYPLPTMAEQLKARFPELGTDADMNGGDVVQKLADWYEEVSK